MENNKLVVKGTEMEVVDGKVVISSEELAAAIQTQQIDLGAEEEANIDINISNERSNNIPTTVLLVTSFSLNLYAKLFALSFNSLYVISLSSKTIAISSGVFSTCFSKYFIKGMFSSYFNSVLLNCSALNN